jgi:hypothetical protein
MWWIFLLFSEPVLAAAEVEYVPRLWEPPASFPATLRDVASRLPPGTDAKDADLVTYAHEGTHFLSQGRQESHGIYMGKGLRVYVPVPRLRTSDVFDAQPPERRTSIWQTYRDQGNTEYWRYRPTMVLDEWNAYRMGCLARSELALKTRAETIRHCVTMAEIALLLHTMSRTVDGYPVEELGDFCRLHLDLCQEAIPDWNERSTVTADSFSR